MAKKKQPQPTAKPSKQPAAAPVSAAPSLAVAPIFGLSDPILLGVCLAITLGVFANTFGAGFVNWDDQGYLWLNALVKPISGGALSAMFVGHTCGNYSPLVVLSYSIEHLFDKGAVPTPCLASDFNPTIYHVSNVLWHVGTTAAVFLLMRSMGLRGWALALVTVLFGIHPLRVESVAWVTERKDVMYGLFYVGALWAYWQYLTQKTQQNLYLGLTLLLGVLSLFSKIQAVALPLSMFAFDYLAGRDFWQPRVWLEKVPFFALSLVFGLVGIHFVGIAGGFEKTVYDEQAGYLRPFFGTYSLCLYLVRVFLPLHLSTFNPYPKLTAVPITYYLSPLPLAAIAYWVWRTTKHTRVVAFGFLFFFVNIFMLLQIKGAGKAFLADRFTYIPYLGLFYVIAYYFNAILEGKWLPSLRQAAPFIAAAFVAILGILTLLQNKTWQSSVALWDNVTNVYPDEPLPWANKGLAYDEKKDYKNAIKCYDESLRVDPTYFDAAFNKGVALFNNKKYNEAVVAYTQAIKIKPQSADAYYSRALAYMSLNAASNAITDFVQAQKLGVQKPPAELHRSLGAAQAGMAEAYRAAANMPEAQAAAVRAIAEYDEAIKINAKEPDYYYMKGNAYALLGKMPEALAQYDLALQLKPDFIDAINNKANALASSGNPKAALPFFDKAIALKPEAANYYFNRGLARNQTGDRAGACADWQKAVQIGYQPAQSMLQQNCK